MKPINTPARPSALNGPASRTRGLVTADGRRNQDDRGQRRTTANVNDGRYGFDEMEVEGGLYSDEIVSRRRG